MTDTIAPSQPRVIRLSDYRPPTWLARTVQLFVDLHEDHALVRARVRYERAALAGRGGAGDELRLDGVDLQLVSLRMDGRDVPVDEYEQQDEALVLWPERDRFELEIVTRIEPQKNTELSGLYRSGSIFCTQMEAEGFRRVTYFQDRPDVLAVWSVTIEADRGSYPMLLSNGNPLDATGAGPFDDLPPLRAGRHRASWHDPFPKPSYLFALVAGDLGLVRGEFVTRSGRRVELRLYCDKGNEGRVTWALASLQRAMAWDEHAFGREYDLDLFMLVAVNDFNMGAMENKGLNIFNAQRVLADAATATDEDFQRIEGVVGHEYFHNWSGNRVTCRDWFQLSLKEGFTVFRDQEFSADSNARTVKRISDVRRLRSEQFAEDAGPMAHPVRPGSYIAIDNFYTRTVYEKGGEVIRMQQALLGADTFRKACDLYFARHDGQAVTTDDFVRAMEETSGRDLSQFRRWYEQAGTPVLTASGSFDAASRRYVLTLTQSCPATPGQPRKLPFHIPVAMGLLGADGRDVPGTSRMLELTEPQQTFAFDNLPVAGGGGGPASGGAGGAAAGASSGPRGSAGSGTAPRGPVPSVLRGFSAPVKLRLELSDEELLFQIAHDSDRFNRWEALQRLATGALLRTADAWRAARSAAPASSAHGVDGVLALDTGLARAFQSVLDAAARGIGAGPGPVADDALDPAVAAELLRLPDESALCEERPRIDIEALHAARVFVRDALARACRERWLDLHRRLDVRVPYSPDAASIGRRALKNAALGNVFLADTSQPTAADGGVSATSRTDSGLALCVRQYESADNLTDRLCALELLAGHAGPERERALADFRTRWQHDALVMNKWFMVQAGADRPGVIDDVLRLARDPLFDAGNPNRLRALYATFAGNLPHFHAPGGRGYQLYGELLLALDPRNAVLAGRFATAFNTWKRHEPPRRDLMRVQLQRLRDQQGLSRNTWEVVDKALA